MPEMCESERCGEWRSSWLFVSIGLAAIGCGGGHDVTGPVPVSKMSTDKVSYERKPGPGLKRFDVGELVITEKLDPAVLPIPSILEQNTEIIIQGTLRWPEKAGKFEIITLEYVGQRSGAEVELTVSMALVSRKNGLHYFETELSKTPMGFTGKCKLRLVAQTIPFDFDPSLGVLPKETSVVVGLAEVEIR